MRVFAHLGCPSCSAPAGYECRRRDGRPRLPHLHRAALALALTVLGWIAERFITADVAGNLRLLIEAEHTIGPHRATRRLNAASGFGGEHSHADTARRPAPEWEHQMLLLAALLQLNVQNILAILNGRSLTLTEERDQADGFYTTLLRLQRAMELLPKDEHRPAGPPTLQDLQRRQERILNKQLIARVRRREELPQRQPDPHLPPARWQITRYDRNGCFEARLEDDHGLLGPLYGGWAAVPEAAAELLSDWSVPARRPVEITWRCATPPPPDRLLPYGGCLLGHCGNDDTPHYDTRQAIRALWRDHLDRHQTRFAASMRQVQQTWPGQASVDDVLRQRTAELNASHPPAPDLRQLLESAYDHHREIGPTSSTPVGLGLTTTCGWIDPVAVARVGQQVWNDFADHRPGTVPAMLTALLDASVEEALRVWSLDEDPIRVERIPGPAGPLYTLGVNGAHRLTAARLAALPGIWATIDQPALPLRIKPCQTGHYGEDAARRVLTCWRGLLNRGLVTGRLDENPGLPAVSTLHLDDAAAIWLLAAPDQAIAWAATYECAYPGALAAAGIPAEVYADEHAWIIWLAATA
ncbi:hypothetical protein [Streptosporangium sandarakinum]|uniref:hypothetical protein n=1 Tax=Streptosporangium sandarakinum TaxID=1260955 RepID=UPI0036C8843C